MRTTTSQQKTIKNVNDENICLEDLGVHLNKEIQKGAVLRGKRGVQRDWTHFFGTVSLHAHQTHMPTQTRRTKNDTGKCYKNRGFRRPLATTSSCGTVFTKSVFQLSRLRCEISMSVLWGHNHKTTLKPGLRQNRYFEPGGSKCRFVLLLKGQLRDRCIGALF